MQINQDDNQLKCFQLRPARLRQRAYNVLVPTRKLTPTRVSKLLGISLGTLGKLTVDLAASLSQSANPQPGRTWFYTAEDVDVLRPAALLAKEQAEEEVERAERARIAATTEETRRATQANLAEARRMAKEFSDVPVVKRWATCNDQYVCPVCGPLNQAEILHTEKFQSGGQEFDGPPAHDGCRCWIMVYPKL